MKKSDGCLLLSGRAGGKCQDCLDAETGWNEVEADFDRTRIVSVRCWMFWIVEKLSCRALENQGFFGGRLRPGGALAAPGALSLCRSTALCLFNLQGGHFWDSKSDEYVIK